MLRSEVLGRNWRTLTDHIYSHYDTWNHNQYRRTLLNIKTNIKHRHHKLWKTASRTTCFVLAGFSWVWNDYLLWHDRMSVYVFVFHDYSVIFTTDILIVVTFYYLNDIIWSKSKKFIVMHHDVTNNILESFFLVLLHNDLVS